MSSNMAFLTRTRTVIKTLNPIKSISTFPFVSQQAQLSPEPIPADPNPVTAFPLPPNPVSGSLLSNEYWRSPIMSSSSSIISLSRSPSAHIQHMAQSMDLTTILNTSAAWMASANWSDMIQLFDSWIRSKDKHGNRNKPDVNLYNHYLTAHVMAGVKAVDLIGIFAQMEEHGVCPNTASFKLVLKAMKLEDIKTAMDLLQRMEQIGNDAKPDDESYDLVTRMLFQGCIYDDAFKYVDKTLKNGHMLSMTVFNECVRVCLDKRRLDLLTKIIEKCQTMDQNRALCPPWNQCSYMAQVALQQDDSKLAFLSLGFMAKWISAGETISPPVLHSVEEGLLVSALGTAGRNYSSDLLKASWALLIRSLRGMKAPNPEFYIAKISAHASIGNLQKAFGTLRDYETAYENSDKETQEELFSPFTSLHPLVVACSKNGYETLDMVYLELVKLSRAEEHPYKSVAALNCVILGCANIWDVDRAYQTFEAISSSFGLSPDIHSFNALIYAFGRLKETSGAVRVFEHLISLGIKPNAMSYSLLVDAHLISRDAKSAVAVIDDMLSAGFAPSKETLKKLRRRCIREMDYGSDERVDYFAKDLGIRMGAETRRSMLFNMDYSIDHEIQH